MPVTNPNDAVAGFYSANQGSGRNRDDGQYGGGSPGYGAAGGGFRGHNIDANATTPGGGVDPLYGVPAPGAANAGHPGGKGLWGGWGFHGFGGGNRGGGFGGGQDGEGWDQKFAKHNAQWKGWGSHLNGFMQQVNQWHEAMRTWLGAGGVGTPPGRPKWGDMQKPVAPVTTHTDPNVQPSVTPPAAPAPSQVPNLGGGMVPQNPTYPWITPGG